LSHRNARATRTLRGRTLPLAALIGSALAMPLNGYACGPDFPNRLLVDRNGTLLYMPEGNFAFEAGRLVAVDKQLPLWESTATGDATETDAAVAGNYHHRENACGKNR
jgi:hypothetical protein